MREGIYIQSTGNGKYTGFVVYYLRGLQVEPFTRCSMPHIVDMAAGRWLVDPMVYNVTEAERADTHSTGLCKCIDESQHLAGNGSWQSHLESVPGEE